MILGKHVASPLASSVKGLTKPFFTGLLQKVRPRYRFNQQGGDLSSTNQASLIKLRRSAGRTAIVFAALALPSLIGVVAASATTYTTPTDHSCYTTFTKSGGHAVCTDVRGKETVYASANCYNWPGDNGTSSTFTIGEGSSDFSGIQCSPTSITEGFINVYWAKAWTEAGTPD
jgi:hypothetical protein